MAAGELLGALAVHLLLTGLPAAAAALFAARRGVASVPLLVALGLAVTAALAMLAFWAYYLDPVFGETLSYLALFGSVAVVAWVLYEGGVERSLLRALATPLALWALGSAFLLCFGFLHGGTAEPLAAGATRFSHPLPGDSYIPQFYAEWFYAHGHAGDAPLVFGEWLSSDRPPLQIGYVLAQRPFGWGDRELQYQVLGVVLQQLWIVGLWALLVAARVGRLTRALAMLVALASPVAIVNGFYVWPKLLPAALLLAAAALVLTPLWERLRGSLWAAALLAALLALAAMGHGSSVFGAIPLLAVAAYRGLPGWRWVGVAVLVGIAVLAPWSAYQKYVDPPGNRVPKWMLAGNTAIDERTTSNAVSTAYREAGVGGTIDNKAHNFLAMAGDSAAFERLRIAREALFDGDPKLALREIRMDWFFNLLPMLGLLLIAPLVMIARRQRARRESPAEWRLALLCFAALAIGALAWGLILFGNEQSQTVLHQGSYLLPLLGIVGCVAGLRAALPRFATWYLALLPLLWLAAYTPTLDPLEGTSVSPLAALLALAGLAGFAAVALRAGGETDAAGVSAPERPSA